MTPAALAARGVGRRYGAHWALRGLDLTIPAGSVTALVGPNGAGKTTLLHLAVGLLTPSAGELRVLGMETGAAAGPELLARVGFVAQDTPLYAGFTVEEMLRLGRHLNRGWDDAVARDRIGRLGIPLERRCGRLSGGQQAQVALAVALAKRPDLLLLDEPLASLDPLARHDFLEALLDAVAERGVTVVLSSHLVGDLERICDHLVLLRDAHLQVAGGIDELMCDHRLLVGPRCDPTALASAHEIVEARHTDRQTSLLVRGGGAILDPRWQVLDATLEDIVLAHLRRPALPLPSPRLQRISA